MFISIAEETGLIVPLGTWVLRQACELGARFDEINVSVNLSARQFQQPDLVAAVRHALLDAGLEARRLKLEITESLAMQDAVATAYTLGELRTLGTKIAIDDFGTGYSSLSYLKQFPLDTLKIDRSFVVGLGLDTQDSAIVRSIIALARSLDLGTTAEGVETETQYEQLRALGCHLAQGYLLGRPAPPRSSSAAPQRVPHDHLADSRAAAGLSTPRLASPTRARLFPRARRCRMVSQEPLPPGVHAWPPRTCRDKRT